MYVYKEAMLWVKPSEIIESFKLYGSEMIVLHLESIRESLAHKNVKYVSVMFKKPDGELARMRIMFDKHKISNNIKEIEDRPYEQIKVSFSESSEFTKAFCLVAESFTKQVKALSNERITDDKKKAHKECTYMPSIEPKVPVQTTATYNDGVVVDLDNPIIWVRMKSKFYSELEIPSLISLDGYYKESGAPLVIKPFDFDACHEGLFYNTGLNLRNCSEVFTRNTLLWGHVDFEAISSEQGFSLSASFCDVLYYETAEKNNFAGDLFEGDEYTGRVLRKP